MTPRRWILLRWAAVFCVGLAAAIWDSGVDRFGAPSDEWAYNFSSRKIATWLDLAISDPGRAFSDSALESTWNYAPLVVVHPPFSRECAAVTRVLGRAIGLDGWRSFRLSSACAFAALAVLLYAIGSRRSTATGVLAVVALVLNVRLHGHARTAQTDMLLTFLWCATAWSWILACERRAPGWLPALLLGLVLATKASGVLLFVPMALLGLIVWRTAALAPSLWLPAAPLISMVFSPLSWVHPVAYWSDWLFKLTDRARTGRIPVAFFGRIYELHAPIWVAIVDCAIVMPEVILAGFLVELVSAMRGAAGVSTGALENRRFLVFVSLTLVPIGSQLFPGTPSHDVERLFLPLLPAASLGCAIAVGKVLRSAASSTRRCLLALYGCGGAVAILGLATSWPYPLAYFNGLVGGTSGADRLGMDAYYFKTEVGTDVLHEMLSSVPDSCRIDGLFVGADLWMWGNWSSEVNGGRVFRIGSMSPNSQDMDSADFWVVYNRRSNILPSDSVVEARWTRVWQSEGPGGAPFLTLYANPGKFGN